MAKEITFKKLPGYWPLYWFVLPAALLVALFSYFPAGSAIYRAFFRWNGDYVEQFVGFQNFRQALGVPLYWILALGLLTASIVFSRKEGPVSFAVKIASGIAGMIVVLGVLAWRGAITGASEGSFVAPLILWGVPLLLVAWRMATDNPLKPIWLVCLAALLTGGVLSRVGLSPVAAWSISLLGTGAALWWLPPLRNAPGIDGLRATQSMAAMGVVCWALAVHAGGDPILWKGFGVIAILVVANLFKMVPSIATAVVIHRLRSEAANYWYRVLFVVPMIIPGMVTLLLWKFFFEPTGIFNAVLEHTGILTLLVHLDLWFGWGGVFEAGRAPIWLNDSNLVLPAIILWGIPWVGVVGVLIYLAGLQAIGTDVYEAAALDGVNAFQKFLHIELPLIMTQVRINLVLMIIGTLQMYGFILILFDSGGGPNGKLLVPGLYMFRNAFEEKYAGYACAIGFIIFVFILILTELNNRFVRVEK